MSSFGPLLLSWTWNGNGTKLTSIQTYRTKTKYDTRESWKKTIWILFDSVMILLNSMIIK